MLKKIVFIILLITLSGYLVGSYFVDFALRRGISNDSPAADELLNNPATASENFPEVEHEIWTITSRDALQLNAVYMQPNQSSHKWVILVHGYGCDQRYAWDYAADYLQNNFNVLTPDMRACGMSEGMYVTMGVKESDDILLWVQKIIEDDQNAQIALHGVSMGAATVLLAASKNPPPNVAAVISDCAYTNVYDIFGDQLEKLFHLPRFPIMNCVDIVSRIKTGAYVSEAAPIDKIQNVKVPVLFIHGTADELVPYQMMNQLYEECGAQVKETETFDNVAHASSKIADSNRYFNRIFSFLEKINFLL